MSVQHGPGWTLDTLKILMDERDRRYSETRELASTAIAVAERNAERWRDNANEWRKAMDDRETKFMHKNMGGVLAALTCLAILLAIAEKFVN